MRKTLGSVGLLSGALILAAYWLGASFGLPGFGRGSGVDGRSSTAPSSMDRPPTESDIITVQIEGDRLLVQGRELTAAQIAALAAERKHPQTGKTAPSHVLIVRGADATVRAKEGLIDALNKRQVLHRVQ